MRQVQLTDEQIKYLRLLVEENAEHSKDTLNRLKNGEDAVEEKDYGWVTAEQERGIDMSKQLLEVLPEV